MNSTTDNKIFFKDIRQHIIVMKTSRLKAEIETETKMFNA